MGKIKGKNFSANNASGLRKESDYYPTPKCLTRRFLDRWNIEKTFTILEPCCGEANAIVKILKEYNFSNITSHDLNVDGVNFLKYNEKVDYLITNPPYSLAYEFICKAKEIVDKEFAMLLPLSYLHGKRRYDDIWLDTKFPLKEIHVFTRYPMFDGMLREDGKIKTGMVTFAWYVWDKNYKGKATINWIDINDCIVGKND
jgi:hypothetical protein